MSKRWLVCLFSYNRSRLLANAAHSIDQFLPPGDRLLIDDGSTDPTTVKVLDAIARRPNWRVIRRDRSNLQDYGGFYANMDLALKTAIREGYDYCQFVEDDHQLIWRKPDYEAYVDKVFATCPDAIQIQPLFFRRAITLANRLEYIESCRAYRTDRGFTTSAVWNLKRVAEYPDYSIFNPAFGSDQLPLNSAYWLDKGIRVYFQYDPTVAVIPWVKSSLARSDDETSLLGRDGAAAALLLNPASDAEIDFIRNHAPNQLPFQEFFNLSEENSARPIWHQHGRLMHYYYSLCREAFADASGKGPGEVDLTVFREWAASRLPADVTHVAAPQIFAQQPRPRRYGALKDLLPPWIKTQLIKLSLFRPLDYLGYLRLCRHLASERKSLSFVKNTKLAP